MGFTTGMSLLRGGGGRGGARDSIVIIQHIS